MSQRPGKTKKADETIIGRIAIISKERDAVKNVVISEVVE